MSTTHTATQRPRQPSGRAAAHPTDPSILFLAPFVTTSSTAIGLLEGTFSSGSLRLGLAVIRSVAAA